MKHTLVFLLSTLAASTALAQTAIPPSPAYQECTSLASVNPALALEKADAWLKIDTGIAAQHCRAMALYGLGRYAEAGDALALVREGITPENISLRSYIARQAARAWMNANQTDKALGMLADQITAMSNVRGDNATTAKLTAEVLLDRARLNISYGKLTEASQDLDHAVSLTPINEEILLERAGLFEKLGDLPLARADAEGVLKLNSKNAGAKQLLTRMGALPKSAANLAAPTSNTPIEATKPKVKTLKRVTPDSQAP